MALLHCLLGTEGSILTVRREYTPGESSLRKEAEAEVARRATVSKIIAEDDMVVLFRCDMLRILHYLAKYVMSASGFVT